MLTWNQNFTGFLPEVNIFEGYTLQKVNISLDCN